jgi:hypothetical protein
VDTHGNGVDPPVHGDGVEQTRGQDIEQAPLRELVVEIRELSGVEVVHQFPAGMHLEAVRRVVFPQPGPESLYRVRLPTSGDE